MYAASSGVARGITPGSLKLVRKSADMTNTNRSAPITGIAGVIRTARNGQLNNTKLSIINLAFFSVDFSLKFLTHKERVWLGEGAWLRPVPIVQLEDDNV